MNSKAKSGAQQATELDSLRQEFSRWRRKRQRGERIPGGLWESAVQAASEHGLAPTARALSLDYYALRKRLEEQEAPASSSEALAPRFVELPLEALTGPCASPAPWQLEVKTPAGVQLKIQCPQAAGPQLLSWIATWWRDQA